MVKDRTGKHAKTNIALFKEAMTIFGRTDLVLRRVNETIDDYGQLSDRTTSDQTFAGDLQFGPDLDQKWISTGIVEVGDAILYIAPDAISPLPKPGDIIVDVAYASEFEVFGRIEAPTLEGDRVHFSFRCRRRIESGDNSS